MRTLEEATSDYQRTLAELFDKTRADPESRLLAILLARDEIAEILDATSQLSVGDLHRIQTLDKKLKSSIQEAAKSIGEYAKNEWRDLLPSRADQWWWSFNRPKKHWFSGALLTFAWIAIAIALSFIVEILKRFLAGGIDVTSTVLQGLVALLVGGSVVQLAHQLVDLSDGSSSADPPKRIKFLAAAALILIAFGLEASLPKISAYYSDRGVIEKKAGHITSAIESYERSSSLKPDDAVTHYNLGLAYEAVLEKDKAESEYVAALRWDNNMCFAYDRLAQLEITRRKDFAAALGLLNTAIEKITACEKHNNLDSATRRRLEYSLFENRAWAQLGLKHPLLARSDLIAAQKLRPEAPGAHCLLGDVLSEQKQSSSAQVEWETCVAQAQASDNENEAQLISNAQEKISHDTLTSGAKDTHK